jgi:hypothetical protein
MSPQEESSSGADCKSRSRSKEANPKEKDEPAPKTPFEEILEYYDLTGLRIRVAFSLWHPPAAKLLVITTRNLLIHDKKFLS